MQAFKIDLMALLVVAVVLGIGLTMALSHYSHPAQESSAAQVNAQTRMPANPVQTQFIKASEPGRALALESRI
jgi:hypothetical protein